MKNLREKNGTEVENQQLLYTVNSLDRQPLQDTTNLKKTFKDTANRDNPLHDITNQDAPLHDVTKCVEPLHDVTNCVEPLHDVNKCVEPLQDMTNQQEHKYNLISTAQIFFMLHKYCRVL